MELKKEVTLAVESRGEVWLKKDSFFHLTVGQIGTKKLFQIVHWTAVAKKYKFPKPST